MKYLFGLILIVCCVGCDDPVQVAVYNTKVSDIRLVQNTRVVGNSNGDPVGGALIGGAIAGKTGAVIGAAVGSERQSASSVYEVTACSFSVEADGHQLVFRTVDDGQQTKYCSLLREGDSISIKKISWSNGFKYLWAPTMFWTDFTGQIVK